MVDWLNIDSVTNAVSQEVDSLSANVKQQATNIIVESYTRLGLFLVIAYVVLKNFGGSRR